jgi:hypothetical protein
LGVINNGHNKFANLVTGLIKTGFRFEGVLFAKFAKAVKGELVTHLCMDYMFILIQLACSYAHLALCSQRLGE